MTTTIQTEGRGFTSVQDIQVYEKSHEVNYELVTNSQDILNVLECEGREELMSDVGCLFVVVTEGDYSEIWGCEQSTPYLDAFVWRIK